MFRTGFLSIIRSLVLYTQLQVYVIQVVLTACERGQNGRCILTLFYQRHVSALVTSHLQVD